MKFPFAKFKISGHSMEPTLKEGNQVLVNQWAYFFRKPKVGEVVVFKISREYWVKRIKRIDAKNLMVEGDNRLDSQRIGPINKKNLVGKLISKI